MSKFWEKMKTVGKVAFNVADDIADGVSPTYKAASSFLESEDGQEAKTDFVETILAGEAKLLEAHSFDKLTARQNEILDEIAVLATEFAIVELQERADQ